MTEILKPLRVGARQDKDVGTLPIRPYGRTKDDGKCSV